MSQPQTQLSSFRECKELRELGELFFAAAKFCDVRELYRNNRRQFSWMTCGQLRERTLCRLLPCCRQFLSDHADNLKSLGINVPTCGQRLDRINDLVKMQLADLVPIAWQMEFQVMADYIEAIRIGSLSATDQDLSGFVPADTLWHEEGIAPPRLSEAVRDGKVRTKPAPKGMKDSQGKRIRTLYHRADAVKHCKPKHVKKKTIQKLARKT